MKRYLSTVKINRITKDFKFLVDKVHRSNGELDIRLREDYFNIYYKGNSLAKIEIMNEGYVAKINQKFVADDMFSGDDRFADKGILRKDYIRFQLSSTELKPFFQRKYIDKVCSRINRVGYSEEVTFEQMLITDNIGREEFLILDRQVTETALKRKRIDLLALRQVEGIKYRYVVIEVKLGNNPELKYDVAMQIDHYIKHIEKHFDDWKPAYEETYRQMKRLNLFEIPRHKEIEIVPGVKGLIVVGGYSGIGRKSIEELKAHFDGIRVKQFINIL